MKPLGSLGLQLICRVEVVAIEEGEAIEAEGGITTVKVMDMLGEIPEGGVDMIGVLELGIIIILKEVVIGALMFWGWNKNTSFSFYHKDSFAKLCSNPLRMNLVALIEALTEVLMTLLGAEAVTTKPQRKTSHKKQLTGSATSLGAVIEALPLEVAMPDQFITEIIIAMDRIFVKFNIFGKFIMGLKETILN